MTLPNDIELREALMQLVVENQYIDGMTEYMPDTALDSTMELIATYRKKWETEAYTNGFRAGAIDTLLELKSQVKAHGFRAGAIDTLLELKSQVKAQGENK